MRKGLLVQTLRQWQQHHVASQLESNERICQQLSALAAWYEGGVEQYVRRAHALLSSSPTPSDINTHWRPALSTPTDTPPKILTVEAPLYAELEQVGLSHIANCAIVLVAGGIGERLGFPDIKLKLPVDTLTNVSYLEYFLLQIQALETLWHQKHVQTIQIPVVIMTSEATHASTQAFLRSHAWFGMPSDQITLLQQHTVPCVDLTTNGTERSLQLVLDDQHQALVMKPHGHGDVHNVLFQSGLVDTWRQAHKTHIIFWQDTNALVTNACLPLLGASIRHDWAWTYASVPRKANDASGALVEFQSRDQTLLLNVEYHELHGFLQQHGHPEGDVNDPTTGYSRFPGNLNHIVAAIDVYGDVLRQTHGLVPEIFNPKFETSERQSFQSPARLECMLQDFPQLRIGASQQPMTTGHVMFRSDFTYSPCKNDLKSARMKAMQQIPPQCASTAEHDLFAANCMKLAAVGVQIERFHGQCTHPKDGTDTIEVILSDGTMQRMLHHDSCTAVGPQIVLSPAFAPCFASLKTKLIDPTQISISARSTLIIQAADLVISRLQLDGALWIMACVGARVRIRSLLVHNDGVLYERAEEASGSSRQDPHDAAVLNMRGYRFCQQEIRVLQFDVPGEYVICEQLS